MCAGAWRRLPVRLSAHPTSSLATMSQLLRSFCCRSAGRLLVRSHAPRVALLRTLTGLTCRREDVASGSMCTGRTTITFSRSFGAFGPDYFPLDMKKLETRVMKVVSAYDKIDSATSMFHIQKRSFGHKAPLTYDFVVERVFLAFQLYDKIDNEKLKLDSHFSKDLGLDSLDHVEVIMAIEDEFSFEIPDVDAEKLMTPADIIKYVVDKEECWRDLTADYHAKLDEEEKKEQEEKER